jgi:hypothetical protein
MKKIYDPVLINHNVKFLKLPTRLNQISLESWKIMGRRGKSRVNRALCFIAFSVSDNQDRYITHQKTKGIGFNIKVQISFNKECNRSQ